LFLQGQILKRNFVLDMGLVAHVLVIHLMLRLNWNL
jgi:hypothetical protein